VSNEKQNEKQREQQQLNDKASPQFRFFVREGCKGWMVYDRHRKGPALIGTAPAVNLTKARAEHLKQMLTQSDGEHSPYLSRDRRHSNTSSGD
jgi:hypothetical protein